MTRDEILVELETDKVTLEVPAPASGVLASIVQPDGATVHADEVIATIDTEGKPGVTSAPATAAAPPKAAPAPAPLRPSPLPRPCRAAALVLPLPPPLTST